MSVTAEASATVKPPRWVNAPDRVAVLPLPTPCTTREPVPETALAKVVLPARFRTSWPLSTTAPLIVPMSLMISVLASIRMALPPVPVIVPVFDRVVVPPPTERPVVPWTVPALVTLPPALSRMPAVPPTVIAPAATS
ncbi:hypothetical protein CFIICLFH_3824 [Methylobacterium goesingense]|nr:hypothetical protein CFIICLFH_3824 [Methylobacterium goesingense]